MKLVGYPAESTERFGGTSNSEMAFRLNLR